MREAISASSTTYLMREAISASSTSYLMREAISAHQRLMDHLQPAAPTLECLLMEQLVR